MKNSLLLWNLKDNECYLSSLQKCLSTNYETAMSFYHMLHRKLSEFTPYLLDETFLKLNFPLTSWKGKYFQNYDILQVISQLSPVSQVHQNIHT
jgi:hypothetical protein